MVGRILFAAASVLQAADLVLAIQISSNEAYRHSTVQAAHTNPRALLQETMAIFEAQAAKGNHSWLEHLPPAAAPLKALLDTSVVSHISISSSSSSDDNNNNNNSTTQSSSLLYPALEQQSTSTSNRKQKKVGSRSFLQVRATEASQVFSESKGASEARVMLNAMLEETQSKIDVEAAKCSKSLEKTKDALSMAENDIKAFTARATFARARILATQTGLTEAEGKGPALEKALEAHRNKCENDMESLRHQIKEIQGDLDQLEKVAEEAGHNIASDDAASLAVVGSDRSETAVVVGGNVSSSSSSSATSVAASLLGLGNGKLSSTASSLQSDFARTALQKTMTDLQRRHSRRQRHVKGKYGLWGRPSDRALIRGSTFDLFLVMQTHIADKRDDMKDSLNKIQSMCQKTETNLIEQATDVQSRLANLQTKLAEDTKEAIQEEERAHLTGKSLLQLKSEYASMSKQCETDLQDLAKQMCSIRQLRGQLFAAENKDPFIQDCEVSDWTPQECSVSCGGGIQTLARSIVVQPQGGSACPPLQMTSRCNEQSCPVDCSMSAWEGWSDCSAACGGGVRERIRRVEVEAVGAGEPCPSKTETESCGNDPCEEDCRLSSWTPWSNCSKACEGGFQVRMRKVSQKAKGAGYCPGPDSESRRQYKRCNEEACKPARARNGRLQCESELDVTFLIDSSSSMGFYSYHRVRKGLASLVMSFPTETSSSSRISIVAFSGPRDYKKFEKCTEATDDVVDPLADCGIWWRAHHFDDRKKASYYIDKTKFMEGSSFASGALAMALADIRGGRASAQPVVVIFTDGQVMSPRRTGEAAKALKQYARLVWVPIGKRAPLDLIKTWASQPVADNVLPVHHTSEFETVSFANRIVTAI
eukprot:CAMPEP_0206436072 /NCGR_PEP_ID=MMETSP0324_2-20121206/10272_1 /ASSEMBLY_ACC=CAM_ASM_000836 /TAXON_ID=2866 /ORGANISM="Crypthecodinium cohnii, Strain Seligo" /LENGTH=876 /DNA_ID=CAMNT_0053903181 /DNA_START=200 /DNA_END=2827 /DNA_ORIENTATION=+